MPAKKLYKVIVGTDDSDLELRVSREINEGWMPCGGIAYRTNVSGPDWPVQAVWRDE